MKKYSSYGMIWAAFLFGVGSLIAFLSFLLIGSFNIVDFRLNEIEAIGVNTGLSLIFFIQHSLMIRKSFRSRLTKFFPSEYYNAFYTIISGVTLIIVIILWQKSSWSLGTATGIYRWVFRLFSFLSIIGFIWGIRTLKYFNPFGIRQILYYLRNKQPQKTPFVVEGPYKWVRHPLYFFMLIMIWAFPDLTADRLLFNILWTFWIFIGTLLEERDLVNEFGNEYIDYKKKVPMLILL